MSQTVVFNYTGSTQSYTVPSGVFSVVVDARGAKGGAGLYSRGGFGGRVQCTMAVTPGDVLYAFVGDSGIVTGGLSTLSSGGYNGGGSGANYGGGGGGGTDIRIGGIALSNRKLVAGGGAGGGYYSSSIDFDRGGSGGNIVAEHGYWNNTVTYGGGAGSPFAGGAGDTYSTPGTAGGFGFGGNSSTLTSGGGGGGGYFGGGGGSSSGGGGGSSYTDTSICTVITHTLGFDSTVQGFLKITPICTLPVAGTVLGPTSICNSQTATLSTSGGTSGGYWVSSNPAVATIGVGTGAITGNSVGIAVISYSVYNSCGSALATTTIEVLPTPVAIVGPASICTGIVSSMTEATAGGVWSSSSSSIASVSSSSGLVYGIAAGTVTISYTLLTGCNATNTILVNTSPAAITGFNNVCVNDGIVLANATPGGTWSTASTAASIGGTTGVVTGLSPGTAIITYSLGSGCKALQNTTVNPVPSAIAGSSAICNGTSTIYTVVTPGGVWSISATGVASISSVSGNVTGLAPGSAIVSYTLITGCTSIAPITINPNPLPIMGATSICTGTSTTLTEFTPGGTWRSSNPGIVSAGLTTGVITGLALGTSTITYTLSTGCYATIPETVYSSPASITGPARVCMGSSITLSDATSGGAWSSGATGIAIVNSTSGTVYGISPGSAIITYGITAGCMAMAVITVNPRPLTIAGPSSICQSSSVILTDPNAGGTWSSSNISMVTINSVSGITSGILAGTTWPLGSWRFNRFRCEVVRLGDHTRSLI